MYLIRPKNILILSWLVWLFFLLISPYNYIETGNLFIATVLLVGYNLFLLLGIVIGESKRKLIFEENSFVFSNAHHKTLKFILLLGFCGVLLSLYSKLQIVYNFSATDLMGNRDQLLEEEELSGGVISVLAAILYPFCYISLIMTILYRRYIKSLYFYSYLLISLLPAILVVLLGGRTTMFFYAITAFFSFLLSSNKFFELKKFSFKNFSKNFLKLKRVLLLLIISISILTFFSFLQNDRLEHMGGTNKIFFDYWSEAQQWDYNKDHPINLFFKDNEPSNSLGSLNFIHYQIHGAFEFSRLITHLESTNGYYYGKYELYPFFKVFKLLEIDIGEDFMEMSQKLKKKGVYTTFWGPFYLDFGIWGLIIIFFVGTWIGKLGRKFYSGQFMPKLFYPFILTVIFTAPILNTFTGSFLYNILAIIGTSTIFIFYKSRDKTSYI